MKLVTFEDQGAYKLGVKVGQGILDVAATAGEIGEEAFQGDVMEVIEGDADLLQKLNDLIESAGEKAVFKNEADLKWGPSVTKPHKIICVGLNYRKHADETNAPYPEYPILFNKFDNTLTGHLEEIEVPNVTKELDYEVELGIVIGKTAKNVSEEEALNYVFGYTAVNDLSARDLQLRTAQWLLGKTCDKFSPLGPYLVTADEIEDPNNLALKTYMNGEIRQDSNTSDMIFTCREIISYISKHMTLVPGDIILTGTPEGVIMGYPEEKRIYIQPGDEVTIEIEKLGTLSNKFIQEA